MSDVLDFLRSVRADLIERRLWPVLLLLAVGFGAAVYMFGGGASTSSPQSASVPSNGTTAIGPVLTPVAPNGTAAIAETANGTAFQRQTGAHDPFTPLILPSAVTGPTGSAGATGDAGAASSSSSSTGGSSSSGSGSSGSSAGGSGSGSGSGGTTVPTPSVPTPPPTSTPPTSTPPTSTKKSSSPTKVNADFRFGLVPTPSASGTTGATGATGATGTTGSTTTSVPLTDLQDYNKAEADTQLPDANDGILKLVGVVDNGNAVRFDVTQALFISGQGACTPSPTNCTQIDIEPGQVESLQYSSPTDGLVQYELAVVSVEGDTVAADASVQHARLLSVLGNPIVNIGNIHGMSVPHPLTSLQLAGLTLHPGVLAPASATAGASR